jgi:hypothetical protein
MENSADENTVIIDPVNDYMPPILKAPVARPDLIAGTSQQRSLCQSSETLFKANVVPPRLFMAPDIHGVVDDFTQVDSGQPGKLK